MEVTGKLKLIKETEDVGTNGFQKRDVVITTDEQYPQHIQIQFMQDKCNLLNGFNVGENVTIGINLSGREWINPKGETVYFNTIKGWKISKLNIVNPTQTQEDVPVIQNAVPITEEEPDDLTF